MVCGSEAAHPDASVETLENPFLIGGGFHFLAEIQVRSFVQTCIVDGVNKGTATFSSPGGRPVSTWEQDGSGTDGGGHVPSEL